MRRVTRVIAMIIGIGLAGGCYTETEVDYPYVAGPDLAYVSPGVEVVAGYDYPVFFVDGLYWLWWDGFWYSSPYWNHGWGWGREAPPRLRGIAHPESYAHYRAAPGYGVRHAAGYSARPTPGFGPHPTHFVAPAMRGARR